MVTGKNLASIKFDSLEEEPSDVGRARAERDRNVDRPSRNEKEIESHLNMPRSGISIAQDSVSRLGLCVLDYATVIQISNVPVATSEPGATSQMISIVSSAL